MTDLYLNSTLEIEPFNATAANTSVLDTTDVPNAISQAAQGVLDIYNKIEFKRSLLPSFVYLIILILIGIPGNLLVVYVYLTKLLKKRMNSITNNRNRNRCHYNAKESRGTTTDIFIISLAFFDLISCFVAMPIELHLLRNFYSFDHSLLCKLSRSVSMFCTTSTSFVLLGISASRFFGIRCKNPNLTVTTKKAKLIVTCSVIAAFVLSLPIFVVFGTYTFPLKGNISGSTCMIENHFLKTKIPLVFIIMLSVSHLIFDAIFIIIYGLISCQVVWHKRSLSTIVTRYDGTRKQLKSDDGARKHSKPDISLPRSANTEDNDEVFSFELEDIAKSHCERKNNVHTDSQGSDQSATYEKNKQQTVRKKPRFSKKKRLLSNQSPVTQGLRREASVHGKTYHASRTTLMLFIVTLAFMITFAPYCIVANIRQFASEDYYVKLSNIQKAVFNLFLRSYFLSSSINPIIYSFLNQAFQRRCKALLYNFKNRFP